MKVSKDVKVLLGVAVIVAIVYLYFNSYSESFVNTSAQCTSIMKSIADANNALKGAKDQVVKQQTVVDSLMAQKAASRC